MFRRDLLAGAAAGAAAAALPRFAIAWFPTAARTLKYVPHANIPNIDPFTNTAFIARDHAFLVYDQLWHERQVRAGAADGARPCRRE